MSTLIGYIYHSRQFTWNKENRTLVSEISSTPEVLRQLWNDSLDLGFAIRSHRTGRIAHFTLQELVKDAEGDTVKWIFIPTLETIQEEPGLSGVLVHVFNT